MAIAAAVAQRGDASPRWALRSQQRFAVAQAAGKFNAEIVPIEVPGRKGPTAFAKDEHNRSEPRPNPWRSSGLRFARKVPSPAGNAPGLNSAGAAMVVADMAWAEQHGLLPVAKLVSYGIGAVEPGFLASALCRRFARHWSARDGR